MPYNRFWASSPVKQKSTSFGCITSAVTRREAIAPCDRLLMRLTGESLAVERGGRLIFSGLDLTAAAGELVVLTGRNGSGKTSLLKLIAGLLEPSTGRLELTGGDEDLSISQQTHLVGHGHAFKPALTVYENLQFWAGFLGGREVETGLEAFGLSKLGGLPAGVLSAGQQRRLNLSRLFLVHRPIWLLDEPSVGLDNKSLGQLRFHMGEHLTAGGLIIAATHSELGMKWTRNIELGDAV
jgi:heme exporter protein A